MTSEVPAVAKDRFTSLDTLSVVRELRALDRARVDKIFDAAKGGWAIAFRVPGEGRRELVVQPGRFAALVEGSDHAEELGPFARELRRLLGGTRLATVAEPGGERFLELEFLAASQGSPVLLAAELFGKGNLIVARDGRILAAQHSKVWAHRAVGVGAPYERPPARESPWSKSVADIEQVLLASRTDRATTLAARMSLGGPVAEELLARAGLAGNAPATFDAPESARRIRLAMDGVLVDVGERPKGYLYLRGGLYTDVEPYPSERFRSDPEVTEEVRPSFSEAALAFFQALTPTIHPEDVEVRARSAELRRQQERQRQAVDEFAAEAGRLAADADAILVGFAEVERLLREAQRTEGTESRSVIDLRLGDRTVPILLGRSIRDSAQSLFEEAKRVRTKLEGAREALAETERRLGDVSGAVAVSTRLRTAPTARRHAPNWFEKYRWFFSSEDVLVIGGRDAATNDLIVRRYLKSSDLYLHAEIHGAPSVIVKHPEPGRPPATDATLQEAGQWGVAFSKAWRAGLASANAFWVTAEQVSKSGGSGEFVAKGAWVIHGTKTFLKDLPTELAIGTLDYKGTEMWTVAPPRALAARGKARFLITPGEERERAEREVELARELGLPRTRLQGMLPAGGLTVRRA